MPDDRLIESAASPDGPEKAGEENKAAVFPEESAIIAPEPHPVALSGDAKTGSGPEERLGKEAAGASGEETPPQAGDGGAILRAEEETGGFPGEEDAWEAGAESSPPLSPGDGAAAAAQRNPAPGPEEGTDPDPIPTGQGQTFVPRRVYSAGRVYSPERPDGYAYARENAEKTEEEPRPRKTQTGRPRGFSIAAAAVSALLMLVLCFGAGMGGAAVYRRWKGSGTVESPRSVIYQSVMRTAQGSGEGESLTVNGVSELASPSVVEIVTESVSYNSFFGQYPTSGAGSGVILSEDGLIVTNYHVVEGANHITVTLTDGKSYDAEVVGADDESDVALVRVRAANLPAAVLGNSESLRVGEGVVAIGNPLGKLGGTVTDGIVSALDREIEIDGQSYRLLQTNAAINPGNSGGGLFNMRGELVGIVNAKVSRDSVEGLGFAIPIDHAKGIIEELSTYGYIRGRIDLGVELIEINDAVTARYYNVSEGGVYVSSVADASTGLRPGDLILSVADAEILNMEDFEEALAGYRAGDTLSLSVKRRVSRSGYETSKVSFILKEKIPEDLGR